MTPLRVVIDANVHVSSLFSSGGSPVLAVRDAWLGGIVRPLVSPDVLAGTERALRKKKLNLSGDAITNFFQQYAARCETAAPPPGLKIPQCRDPEDQCFLDLAFFAEAAALISGDNDLLVMAAEFSVPILNARDFMNRFLHGGSAGRSAAPPGRTPPSS